MSKLKVIVGLILLLTACRHPKESSHQEMVNLLADLASKNNRFDNLYANTIRAEELRKRAEESGKDQDKWALLFEAGQEELNAGLSEKAVTTFLSLRDEMLAKLEDTSAYRETFYTLNRHLALANLRLGEQENCIHHHSSSSCIMPVLGDGIHEFKRGSKRATEIYLQLLRQNPEDVENVWLFNLAHQTLGTYPDSVPKEFLIPPHLFEVEKDSLLPTFKDVAPHKGVGINQLSGGSIIEDFNNDGYLDIMASSWGMDHQLELFWGKGDFSFERATDQARLTGITGGLNLLQTDYDNDGFADVLVLRGAWRGSSGRLPNSLLHNNGNGTFTDVTILSDLLSMRPTQAAVWQDFNKDGWLDLFIVNETYNPKVPLPTELFINKGNGSFEEKSLECGASVSGYLKGVTAADYDQDGLIDIFISNLEGQDFFLKNTHIDEQGNPHFKEVSQEIGLSGNHASFPCWFFDYDQDGWEDLMVFSLNFRKRYALVDVINDFVGNPVDTDKARLYRNNQDGTFTNVSSNVQLDKVILAMGCNFGDIDNDGWLDFYAGTGTPTLNTIIPNRMFRNVEGKTFEDVTFPTRTGHVQKGHGISFADLDEDGDLDIHATMGGAVEGDVYPNALFQNQLTSSNHWIEIKLQGNESNKAAIGSKIEAVFQEKGNVRRVYKTVNTGGSFGASPFQQHLGLGHTPVIDTLKIHWYGSDLVQEFYQVEFDKVYFLEEGKELMLKEKIEEL